MILLIAGLAVWLLLMALVVALCRSAALGDRTEIVYRVAAPRRRLLPRLRERCPRPTWIGLHRQVPGRH